MARDTIAIQTVSETVGRNVTFVAFVQANGGLYVNTGQNARACFINAEAVAKTITVSTNKTVSNQAAGITSKTFTLPASAVLFELPAFSDQFWAQTNTSNIHIDIDDDTAVTWAVVGPA